MKGSAEAEWCSRGITDAVGSIIGEMTVAYSFLSFFFFFFRYIFVLFFFFFFGLLRPFRLDL